MDPVSGLRNCIICDRQNVKCERARDGRDIYYYECPTCGDYGITDQGIISLKRKEHDRFILSGVTKNASKMGKKLLILSDEIESLIKNAPVPTDLFQYIDRVLLFIDERTDLEGLFSKVNKDIDYSNVFSRSPRHFESLLRQAAYMNYIAGDTSFVTPRLTTEGWKRVLVLKKSNTENSKLVFMAMQYGDESHNKLFKEKFKPAVDQTGFTLVRLDDRPSAGLIDNRLRVEIRNCRFLLADVTNENRGAYWEAGYAEGLGKQVIYLCDKKDFTAGKVHFDVNHHTTIIWDEANIDAAVEDLKATIRATFPSEAIMTDKE